MTNYPNHLTFVMILLSITMLQCTRIILINNKPNDYLIKHQGNRQHKLIPMTDDTLNDSEKICSAIQSTFQVLGKDSMNIYKSCQEKYELLGRTDKTLQLDDPDCYDSLSKFFCNYYIESSNMNQEDYDLQLVKFILSLTNQCINFESKDEMKSEYTCPSLDINTYFIEDPILFCTKAEKKINLIDTPTKETIEFLRINESKQRECLQIVNAYNSCINVDNLLYPHGDYTKCFNDSHPIYLGNTIKTYTNEEKALCQNYILPAFASRNLRSGIPKGSDSDDICVDFDKKILKQHDAYSNGADSQIDLIRKDIKEEQHVILYISEMMQDSKVILDMISGMITQWKLLRESIIQIEGKVSIEGYKEIELLNGQIDLLFEASVVVQKLFEQKDLKEEELTPLLPYYHTVIENAKMLFRKVKKQFEEIDDILENNGNDDGKNNGNVIKEEAMEELEKKINQMAENEKKFLKFIREILIKSKLYHENKLKTLQEEQQTLVSYKNRLAKQKDEYSAGYVYKSPLLS